MLVAHCDALADRFAVLDVPEPSLLNAATAVAEAQAHATALRQATGSANVALYAPWLKMVTDDGPVFVPPSGHVAGVYARFAEKRGVHHAPANEPLADVVDLRIDFDDDALATLYPPLALDETGRIADPSVNLIRALPARGLRVWGARTLSAETRWRSIAVRRLVIDIERWLTRRLDGMVFEVNDVRLRSRVIREVGARLDELYLAGALVGAVSELAWSIQCDETNNPADVRLAGLLVADIEIAPAVPGEYITLRLIHRSGTDGSTQTLTS